MRKFVWLFNLLAVMLLASRLIADDAAAALPDEKTLEAIVDNLASDDFKIRQEASDKLTGYGPDIVPLLKKYAQSDNPEIRTRVAGILRSFDWVKRGALIIQVEEPSPAKELGISPGDVIVKFNDTLINQHTDVQKASALTNGLGVLYLWRDGKVRKVNTPAGRWGTFSTDWDLAKAGKEHSRGYTELFAAKPQYDAAYRDLKAAKEAGISNATTMKYLAALAARKFEKDYAFECYSASYHGAALCDRSHRPWPAPVQTLPFENPHTQLLLERYRTQQYLPMLAHELEDWFSGLGRNRAMAQQLLTKDVVGGWQNESHRHYHELSVMRLAMADERYRDVLKMWELRPRDPVSPGAYDFRNVMILQAAIRTGESKTASKLALDMLTNERLATKGQPLPLPALWAFAEACAVDDRQGIDDFLERLGSFSPGEITRIMHMPSVDTMYHPATSAVIRKWLAGRPLNSHTQELQEVALTSLVADPTATREQFQSALAEIDEGRNTPRLRSVILTALVRFGEYERAAGAGVMDGRGAQGLRTLQMIKDVADFAAAHHQELQGPWKSLKGMIQIAQAGDGSHWAMRFDGAVIGVSANGELKELPGLPLPPPSPVTVLHEHVVPREKGVVVIYPFNRTTPRSQHFYTHAMACFLNETQQRWTGPEGWDGKWDFAANPNITAAIVGARADKDHPREGKDRRRLLNVLDTLYWCDGDILYYQDSKTHALTDLNVEIARLAGRKEPVHVYAPSRPIGAWHVLFTDCGAWRFNRETAELKRLDLALANPDVMTCDLPENAYFDRPDDRVVVAVAPQQGGEMFLVKPVTGTVEKVDGFNGIGPADWFAREHLSWHALDPQAEIDAQFRQRIGKP